MECEGNSLLQHELQYPHVPSTPAFHLLSSLSCTIWQDLLSLGKQDPRFWLWVQLALASQPFYAAPLALAAPSLQRNLAQNQFAGGKGDHGGEWIELYHWKSFACKLHSLFVIHCDSGILSLYACVGVFVISIWMRLQLSERRHTLGCRNLRQLFRLARNTKPHQTHQAISIRLKQTSISWRRFLNIETGRFQDTESHHTVAVEVVLS